MNQEATKLVKSASAAVIFPIGGMLGGLLVGGLRASSQGPDEMAQIACVIKWAIAGFFAGLVLILFLAIDLRGKNIVSIRRLIVIILIAGLISWYITRILFGAIGYEGF